MSTNTNFPQPDRTDGLCLTCPYMGRCGQPTSCPGPRPVTDTAIIADLVGSDHGPSLLPNLLLQVEIERLRVAWVKEFARNRSAFVVHDTILMPYNEEVESQLVRLAAFGFFPELDFYRADGRVECKVCGEAYSRHPMYPLFPFLHIVCNGDLVKL